MNVGIIGAGKLGICFALLIAKSVDKVFITDKNIDYLNTIKDKTFISNEPSVNELIKSTDNLECLIDLNDLIKNCEIIYTFVDTPSNDDGTYNITNLESVIKSCLDSKYFTKKCFVVGCTVNPSDTAKIADQLLSRDIETLYNPEFIAQGSIIKDLENSDLVLIGGDESVSTHKLKNLYSSFMKSDPVFSLISHTAAEITKVAINSYLNTKITFANMIGSLLIKAELENEIDDVLNSIGSDSRIGRKYLGFGLGFGGPCLPRDNIALVRYAEKFNLDLELPLLIDKLNNSHREIIKDFIISKNIDSLPYYIEDIGFKKDSDIITESTRLYLVEDLLNEKKCVYIKSIFDSTHSKLLELESKYELLKVVKSIDEVKEKIFVIEY